MVLFFLFEETGIVVSSITFCQVYTRLMRAMQSYAEDTRAAFREEGGGTGGGVL